LSKIFLKKAYNIFADFVGGKKYRVEEVWGTAAIECWDVTSCYRIIGAKKEREKLEIEL
jgi:hypothetical protein